MARVTRSSKPKSPAKEMASPAETTVKANADTPIKSVEDAAAARTKRQQRLALRSREYKRQKRQRAVQALKTLAKDPDQPLSQAQHSKARAEIYRKRKPKASKTEKLSELEQMALRQQDEIQQLRQQAGDARKSPDSGRGGRRARKSTA